MFFRVRLVSSRTSRARTFSKMSNQWCSVSFGVLMKSEVSIFPPLTAPFIWEGFFVGGAFTD